MITFFEAKKGFTLLAVSYKEFAAERLIPLGLNLTEANILHTLFNEGEGISQEIFVLNLFLDKASVSRNVRSLIKKGFITRHRDPLDRRAHQIYFTQKAQELKDLLNTIFDNWLNQIVQDVEESETQAALRTFEKFICNAQKLMTK